MVGEDKTKKRAKFLQHALKGIDPMKVKLNDAKDFLGSMGILSRTALRTFSGMLKQDLSILKDLMDYKWARDYYLLQGDTTFYAAKKLHELRPEFTIDPPWRRRRRAPYPDPPKDWNSMRTLNVLRPKWELYYATEPMPTSHRSLEEDILIEVFCIIFFYLMLR
jgi:hypothetical protein